MGPRGMMRRGRRRGLVVGAAVGAAAAHHRQPTGEEDYTPPEQDPLTEELERLARLRDEGVLSSDEFEAKKKQLLQL